MRSHINELISQVFALLGSLPVAAEKINISQDIISAIVIIVQIKNVAERIMSCANNETDVVSHSFLTDFLIHKAS